MILEIEKLPEDYFVAKVSRIDSALIEEISSNSFDFWTVSKSPDENSLVSTTPNHPSFQVVEGPWSAFRIAGPLDFSLTGILSRCSTLLANASISVFAISTFDTDYFLVRKEFEKAAINVWREGGIKVELN